MPYHRSRALWVSHNAINYKVKCVIIKSKKKSKKRKRVETSLIKMLFFMPFSFILNWAYVYTT